MLGLALVVDQTDGNIGRPRDGAGITGFIASSVAEAADGTKGWAVATALVVALLVLAYQSAALLRAVRAVTALAWRLPVTKTPSPTRSTPLRRLAGRAFIAIGSSAAPIRRALDFPLDVAADRVHLRRHRHVDVARAVVVPAAPRCRAASATFAGAILVGVGIAAIGLFNTLILFPWLTEREETYGVLGVAAGLLFGFFLVRSDGGVGGCPQRDPGRGTTA